MKDDNFIKWNLTTINFADGFLHEATPEDLNKNLNFSTLEIKNTSFVDDEMKDHHSDIIYSIKLQETDLYIYTLLEHKSYIDKNTGIQISKYINEMLKEMLNNEGKINPIILILFYTGDIDWKIEGEFKDFIPDIEKLPESMEKYIYNFPIIYFDLSKVDKNKDIPWALKIFFNTLIDAKRDRKNILKNFLKTLDKFIEYWKDNLRQAVNAYVNYMNKNIDIEEDDPNIQETIREIYQGAFGEKKGDEYMKTYYDVLLERGIEQGAEQIAIRLFETDLSDEQIAESTSLSLEKVEKLRESVLEGVVS